MRVNALVTGVVMTEPGFTVFLVGHEAKLVKFLVAVLRRGGYKTKIYPSSESFLCEHNTSIPGCAVLDLSMHGLSGLNVQQTLVHQEIERPVVFLTDHVTVPITVQAMRAGAVDVLLKPVEPIQLLQAIKRAQERDDTSRHAQIELHTIGALIQKLSPREHEVLIHVIAGLRNKQIAEILGVGVKTIKVHRGRAMKKMEVDSVAELVRITTRISLQSDQITRPPSDETMNGHGLKYLVSGPMIG